MKGICEQRAPCMDSATAVMSHLVHTGSVDVPDAAAQCTDTMSFQASPTSLERPEAEDRQLYLVIELYRRTPLSSWLIKSRAASLVQQPCASMATH